jgi:prepilin-type N-terminal cleavage/methylation domain-containing protein
MGTKRSASGGEAGFTMIELMLVMVVLGVLSAIVLFAVGTLRTDAQSSTDASNAKICATAKTASAVKHGGDESHWADYLEAPASC